MGFVLPALNQTQTWAGSHWYEPLLSVFLSFLFICFLLYVYVNTYVYNELHVHARACWSQELKLQISLWATIWVLETNWTLVLLRNITCSWPLSHISSTLSTFLYGFVLVFEMCASFTHLHSWDYRKLSQVKRVMSGRHCLPNHSLSHRRFREPAMHLWPIPQQTLGNVLPWMSGNGPRSLEVCLRRISDGWLSCITTIRIS